MKIVFNTAFSCAIWRIIERIRYTRKAKKTFEENIKVNCDEVAQYLGELLPHEIFLLADFIYESALFHSATVESLKVRLTVVTSEVLKILETNGSRTNENCKPKRNKKRKKTKRISGIGYEEIYNEIWDILSGGQVSEIGLQKGLKKKDDESFKVVEPFDRENMPSLRNQIEEWELCYDSQEAFPPLPEEEIEQFTQPIDIMDRTYVSESPRGEQHPFDSILQGAPIRNNRNLQRQPAMSMVDSGIMHKSTPQTAVEKMTRNFPIDIPAPQHPADKTKNEPSKSVKPQIVEDSIMRVSEREKNKVIKKSLKKDNNSADLHFLDLVNERILKKGESSPRIGNIVSDKLFNFMQIMAEIQEDVQRSNDAQTASSSDNGIGFPSQPIDEFRQPKGTRMSMVHLYEHQMSQLAQSKDRMSSILDTVSGSAVQITGSNLAPLPEICIVPPEIITIGDVMFVIS
ncbi:hypothetical protein ACOME3_010077 [Neoechinorhynchus agilis]